MQTRIVIAAAACLLLAAPAHSQDDESIIEQLVVPGRAAAPRAHAHAPRLTLPDDWIGRRVRVDTTDRGLYIGTLQAATADTLTLEMALPQRALRYSLPRSAVAAVEPLDEVAP
jgi:hypothetical protein